MKRVTAPAASVQLVEGVILLVHPQGRIPPQEWSTIVEQMQHFGASLPVVRVVVCAEGTLDTEQRRDLKQLSQRRTSASNTPVMLISESLISRGVMQALAWMGMRIACTSRKNAPVALGDVGFSPQQIDAVLLAITAAEKHLST